MVFWRKLNKRCGRVVFGKLYLYARDLKSFGKGNVVGNRVIDGYISHSELLRLLFIFVFVY